MPDTFYDVLTAAVSEFAERGYDDEAKLALWLERLREAALRDLVPEAEVDRRLRASLGAVYRRMIEREEILRHHPGVGRFTLARVKPELQLELSRRILASADLIRLNRARAIETTLQRFAGWATSVPPGGTPAPERRATKVEVRKALASLPFRERRVAIDQGNKFLANLNDILARDGGAIAGIWRQHYTRHPRHTHRQRDGKVYLVRGSWAHQAGLVKPGPAGYTDEISRPGEEVFCRCTMEFCYALRDLPADMITERGRAELERVRRELAA